MAVVWEFSSTRMWSVTKPLDMKMLASFHYTGALKVFHYNYLNTVIKDSTSLI